MFSFRPHLSLFVSGGCDPWLWHFLGIFTYISVCAILLTVIINWFDSLQKLMHCMKIFKYLLLYFNLIILSTLYVYKVVVYILCAFNRTERSFIDVKAVHMILLFSLDYFSQHLWKKGWEKSPGSATITNRSPSQTLRGRENRQIQTSTNWTNVRKALGLALSSPSEVIAMIKVLKNTRTKWHKVRHKTNSLVE